MVYVKKIKITGDVYVIIHLFTERITEFIDSRYFHLLEFNIIIILTTVLWCDCDYLLNASRLQITWNMLNMTQAIPLRIWKHSPWRNNYCTILNYKLRAHFHLMKLSCGRDKVDLSWSKLSKSSSETLGTS